MDKIKTIRPNLYDYLKVIAIITMIVDHIGYFFLPDMLWLRLIGRVAFPIFLFLVGFSNDYKFRKDIILRAIILQIGMLIPFFRGGIGSINLNILFGIFLAKIFLHFYQRFHRYIYIIIIVIITVLLQGYLNMFIDYGFFVILFPLAGYLLRNHKENIGYNIPFLALVFGLHFLFSNQIFGFDQAQNIVLSSLFVCSIVYFLIMTKRNYTIKIYPILDKIFLYISKNALIIYVLHVILFSIVATLISFISV